MIRFPIVFLTDIDYTFKQNPENKTVVNGSRVKMTCDAPSHYPTQISYKWYKEYRVVTGGGRLKILITGPLVFNPVLKSDQGVYFCEAYNPASHQTRSSIIAYLTVHGRFICIIIYDVVVCE